jgi:hypothetical protein
LPRVARILAVKHRRAAFFDHVFRPVHGVCRVHIKHMPDREPVEEHP